MRTLFFVTLACAHCVTGLITLGSIRDLTDLVGELKGRIVDCGDGGGSGEQSDVVGVIGRSQIWLGGRRDECEDTITAALRTLCLDLLVELEKPPDDHYEAPIQPLSPPSPLTPPTSPPCSIIIQEFHHFLKETVKFLYAIQERQMLWRWTNESGPFDGLAWLQVLWASRRANSQERSFIEQQMELYKSTGCFGKSQEVLTRNVEVVEYLNDLLDSF